MTKVNGTDPIAKAKAFAEVLTVFTLTFLAIFAVRLTPVWSLQRSQLGYEFINSALMFFIPLFLLVVTRRDFAEYGLRFTRFGRQLMIVGVCIIPVGAANMVQAYVDHTSLGGSLVLAGDHVLLLLVVAWLLKPRASSAATAASVVFPLLVIPVFTSDAEAAHKLLATVYCLLFVGFGEEMFNRGYVQSRLNAVLGRPYVFFGVSWGWGLIFSSLLFGIGHFFTHFNPFLGEFGVNWWWGFWTIFSGLVFGYLRERTGSIFVPAIIHGLPLAVAYVFFGAG